MLSPYSKFLRVGKQFAIIDGYQVRTKRAPTRKEGFLVRFWNQRRCRWMKTQNVITADGPNDSTAISHGEIEARMAKCRPRKKG